MLPGNGRHRRPRQAPAFVLTAGVTGAGIALPLLSAAGAQAADGSAWDHVAQCASGGLWSADQGDGHYGGLQLTLGQWRQHGGEEFADRPDYASRAQQITVAERLLRDEGPQAFGCDTDALQDNTRAPQVDPGLLHSGEGLDSGADGAHYDRADLGLAGGGTADAGGRPADRSGHGPSDHEQSGDPRDSGDARSGDDSASGRHRGSAHADDEGDTAPGNSGKHRRDDDGATDDGALGDDPLGDDPLGDGRLGDTVPRIGGAERTGADQRGSGNPEAGRGGDTVRPGDNRSRIADHFDMRSGRADEDSGNAASFVGDHDAIDPGQTLEIGLP